MQSTLRRLTVTWPLVIFLLVPALTRAETAVQAWVQRFNEPGSTYDLASAVAVDGSNNVIVMGYSMGSGSAVDCVTIKYSSAGVPLWTNRYNGPENGNAFGIRVAVDGNNNVIVTGYSTGVGSGYDYATIKYSSAGVPLWTNRYNGPGNGDDVPNAVAVDGSDNVIVTGYSSGNADAVDYATIEYSSAGVPLWTNRFNGPGNGKDEAAGLAVDRSNNVVVTGCSEISPGSVIYDYLTIKYSSAGVPLWTNRYNGPGNGDDRSAAVVVDASNNVIVAGSSQGGGGVYDYTTIKYSGAGVPLWTNRYHGPGNGVDLAYALAVDSSNNVIVTGGAAGDCATIKYSSAGVALWTNRYNGPDDYDYGSGIAIDARDNVIVVGNSWNGRSGDWVMIKYSSAGIPLWTNRYNGPANGDDYAASVTLDRSGNVIVTGCSVGSTGYHEFASIKYICVPSPLVTGLQLTNGTFQLRVDDVLQPGTLVMEASTNLSTSNWSPFFTNTTPTNTLFCTDPAVSNSPTRFYRAFQFP